MPGSIASATTPTTVLPLSLSRSFQHSREWLALSNVYIDGGSQRRSLVTTSRKSWDLAKALTPTELSALLAFGQGRRWSDPFYFYDGTETTPKWGWDPTGVSAVGRYIVVFGGPWSHVGMIPRLETQIRLVEVA